MKLFDGIKEKLGALGGAKGLIYIAAALAAGLLCLFLSRGDDGTQDTSVETAEVDYRAEAEDKLRALLNSVSGVSGARVIITFSDGVRYEYGEGGYSRSSPPVVNMGCRAFSTSGMPRPRSLTLTSSTFPSQIFAFTSTLPRTLG